VGNRHSETSSSLGYIHVTQSFCILAVLWGLVSVSFLVLSCIPALSAPGRGPLVSTVMAFSAGMNGIWAVGTPRLVNPAGAKLAQLSLVLVPSSLHISGYGSVHQYEMEPDSIFSSPDILLLVLLPRLGLLHPLPLCR
jgi:hypothetical protein